MTAGPGGHSLCLRRRQAGRDLLRGRRLFPRASARLVYDGRDNRNWRRRRRPTGCATSASGDGADPDLVGARRGGLAAELAADDATSARSPIARGCGAATKAWNGERAGAPLRAHCGRFAAPRRPFSARTLTRRYISRPCPYLGRDLGLGAGRAILMTNIRRSLLIGGLGALLLARLGARAQDNNSAGAAPPPAVGNPQLRDFQLPGRSASSPSPAARPAPVVVAPPPPVTPAAAAPRRAQARPGRRPPQPRAAGAAASAAPAPGRGAAGAQPPPPSRSAAAAAPGAAARRRAAGRRLPLALRVPVAALALLGLRLAAPPPARGGRGRVEEAPRRRRRAAAAPRPEPVPRPWLELDLKAERASATLTETVVQFELEIANTGKSPPGTCGSTSRCSTPAPSRTRRSAPSSAPPAARAPAQPARHRARTAPA